MKVGITGHQERNGIDWRWVEAALEREFNTREIDTVYSSLAVGSDQLFVTVAARHRTTIVGVLPFEDYQRTFEPGEADAYRRLLSKCDQLIVLDWPGNDELAFLNAGKRIVSEAALLFAIWDGKKAAGLGGTADIVEFARKQGKAVLHINPIERSVAFLTA